MMDYIARANADSASFDEYHFCPVSPVRDLLTLLRSANNEGIGCIDLASDAILVVLLVQQ